MENYYTTGEREFLLKIARLSLERFLFAEEKYEPQTINKKLWEKRGVNVILSRGSQIIGDAGNVEPVESLILAIRDNALLAVNNPKYDRLEAGEVDNIKIEISILFNNEIIKFSE